MSEHSSIEPQSALDHAIRDNHMCFAARLDEAERLAEDRRPEECARALRDAAHFAWQNGTGLFASPRLESIAFRIAPPTDEATHPSKTGGGAPERILHVLTQSYFAGGHSRLAWRWMRRDAAREHACVLTQQCGAAIPPQLVAAVEASGGRFTDLDDGPEGLLQRALRLRALSAGYDLIVLHTHPHDVTPLLAYAPQAFSGRIVVLNHASHVFWLGLGVARGCICLLEEGVRLSSARRNFSRDRCVLLPLPLDAPETLPARAYAREQLGLPEQATVMLSSGSPYKFNPVDGVDFRDLVSGALQRRDDAHLVLAGPGANDYWETLRSLAPGRIHLLGYIPEERLELCYAAADIYLDAAPFGSGTALLEAASRGLPVLSFASPQWRAAGLCFDQDGIDPALFSFDRADAYRARLDELLDDPALRQKTGARLQEDVRAKHFDPGWNAALERMYAESATLPPPDTLADHDEPHIEAIDRFLECIAQAAQATTSPPAADASIPDESGTGPADEARRYRQAETLIDQQRPYAALSILDALVQEGSSKWEVHNDLATLHFQNGLAEQALRHMRRAVELDTSGIDALLNLGRMYLLSGIPGHALAALGEALQRRPGDATTRAVIRDAAIVIAHHDAPEEWIAASAQLLEADIARLRHDLDEIDAKT